MYSVLQQQLPFKVILTLQSDTKSSKKTDFLCKIEIKNFEQKKAFRNRNQKYRNTNYLVEIKTKSIELDNSHSNS